MFYSFNFESGIQKKENILYEAVRDFGSITIGTQIIIIQKINLIVIYYSLCYYRNYFDVPNINF